jgi:hypothetical protein
LLFKARQVADQLGGGAGGVGGAEGGLEGEEGKAVLEFAVHGLKGDLFPGLLEFTG